MEKEISLETYFNSKISDLVKFHEEREKRFLETIDSLKQGIQVANESLKEYKAQANEFRGQLKDQASTFVQISTFEEFKKSYETNNTQVQKILNENRGKSEGVSSTWTTVLTILGMIVGAIGYKILGH